MENELVSYVYQRRRLVGAVIATKIPGSQVVYVTGSLCHRRKDKFTKEQAIVIAKDRALTMSIHGRPCAVPYSLKNDIAWMAQRAKMYFKGLSVIASPVKKMEVAEWVGALLA